MTLEQVFLDFAKQGELQYRFGFASDNTTKSAQFYVNYNGDDYQMHCFFVEDERMMVMSADLGIQMQGDRAQLLLLNELNGKSKFCTFFWDDAHQAVQVKSAQMMQGDAQQLQTLFTQQLTLTAMTAATGVYYLNKQTI